jgi:hypothetical protein
MKKLLIILTIGLLLVGSLFAQNRSRSDFNHRSAESNSITVNGVLALERGSVTVRSENEGRTSVYYVPMLNRFIGFINGLREGANVSVEGYQFRNFIQPAKITIDGRAYDFTMQNRAFRHHQENFRNNQNHQFAPNRNNHSNRNHNQNRGRQQQSCCCRR